MGWSGQSKLLVEVIAGGIILVVCLYRHHRCRQHHHHCQRSAHSKFLEIPKEGKNPQQSQDLAPRTHFSISSSSCCYYNSDYNHYQRFLTRQSRHLPHHPHIPLISTHGRHAHVSIVPPSGARNERKKEVEGFARIVKGVSFMTTW